MENESDAGDGLTPATAQDQMDETGFSAPLNRRYTFASLGLAGVCAVALFMTLLPAAETPPTPKPVGVGNGVGRPAGMTEDARMSSYPMWGGHPILKAGPGVTDEAGSASAWMLDGSSVDPDDLIGRLKRWSGASGPLRDEYGTLSIGDEGASVSVSRDELRTYNAWISTRNPWSCPASASSTVVDPSGTGVISAPDSFPGSPSVGSSAMAGPELCPAADRDAVPSDADAVRQARDVFEQIGIDVDQFSFSAQRGDLSVDVIATLMVEGRSTSMTSNASVGPLGVFSVYGFAAQPRQLPDYPVVGARTAALRSVDPRWNQFGPFTYGNWGQVMPMAAARDAMVPESAVSTSVVKDGPMAVEPTANRPVRTVDGRPVLVGYVAEVKVDSAILELSQFSLSDGRLVLLPVWVYTASDGSRWSMLAITDEHVEFIAS